MKRTLLLSLTCSCLLAASAAAQTKTATTPKLPQAGYYPPPTGTQMLVVGGSDDCSTAAAADAIVGVGTFAVTNVGATNGAPDAVGCVNTQLDVWFYWTATSTGPHTLSLCGGVTVDTVVTVWDDGAPAGSCPTTSVACNDDSCGLQSVVNFNATSGQSFFFQIGAFNSTVTYSGTFTVSVPPPPPVNDDCSTPIALAAGPQAFAFDTTSATTGTQGQAEALCLWAGTMAIRKDAWWTWTPSLTGTATLSTCGTTTPVNGDTKIAVYDGSGCPVAAAIACNDDASTTNCVGAGLNTIVSFPTVCGQTYTFQLGQFPTTGNITGTVVITEVGAACPTGPGLEYCDGDGVGAPPTTPCPCANPGAAGNGCASSFNPAGAHITASGSTIADNVVLTGTGMQATGICVFLQGDAIDPNGFQFGDGITCTGGALVRLRGVALGVPANGAEFPVPPETITLSARGGVTPGSGAIRSYTVFYRNAAAAFCPPFTFNCANSYAITW